MDTETIARLSVQAGELKRAALILSADAHFYNWQENEFTIRADEVCAAVQRLEWALKRLQEPPRKRAASEELSKQPAEDYAAGQNITGESGVSVQASRVG